MRCHDPVLGRWLGLTPEQPAHRGFPECPRAAPSRVVDPPGLGLGWVGVGEPRGRLGGLYAKNVTICPTQASTTPFGDPELALQGTTLKARVPSRSRQAV